MDFNLFIEKTQKALQFNIIKVYTAGTPYYYFYGTAISEETNEKIEIKFEDLSLTVIAKKISQFVNAGIVFEEQLNSILSTLNSYYTFSLSVDRGWWIFFGKRGNTWFSDVDSLNKDFYAFYESIVKGLS